MAKKKNPQLELRRRQQLIMTTLGILVKDSCYSFTLDKVSKEAGISKGLVCYYFKSKDDLILETMAFFLNQHKQKLLNIIRMEIPARERIRMLVDAALPSHEEVKLGLSFVVEVVTFSKGNSKVMENMQEFYKAYRQICEELIQIGVKDGYVKAQDIPWTLTLIHALFDGLSLQLAMDQRLNLQRLREHVFQYLEEILTKA